MDDRYEEEYYEDEEYIEPHDGEEFDDREYDGEEYDDQGYDDDYDRGFEEDNEFYDDEEDSDIFDATDNYRHDDEEWTVVTQSFYEQYGAEIQASVKELPANDVYEQYEGEDEEERERVFRPKKKRKKKHYFLKFLAVCCVVAVVLAIAFSPVFNIKEIKVVGAVNNPAAKIIKESGVKVGDNIFKVRRSTVSDALGKNAYLSSVDIERELPGTLIIVVKERTEMSYIAYGNEYIVLDSLGCVLRKTTKRPKLSQLLGVTIKEMDIGKVIEVKEKESFEKDLEILSAMNRADLFFKKIQTKKTISRAYLRDTLLCKGESDILIKNIENGNLRAMLEDLRKRNKKKGTIILNDEKYGSYSPKVE